MSIHVCKCGNEWHLRYPGMTKEEAQSVADRINAGALYTRAALPAGWKAVPIEPTQDMMIAGQEAWMVCDRGRPAMEDCKQAIEAYKAMLSAAPDVNGASHDTE